jgi:signal transduction histidine kinase
MNDLLRRGLLGAAEEPLLALNRHGTIVEANDAAARLLTRARRHLIGKPFASLLPLDARRAFRHAHAEALAEPSEVRLELPLGVDLVAPFVLRRIPGVQPPSLSVRFGTSAAAAAPAPAIATEVRNTLESLFRRFPHGVLGVRPDLHVAFANPAARRLLSTTPTVVGTQLASTGDTQELHALAERLVRWHVPQPPTDVRVRDKSLRVSGIAGRDGQPSVLVLEDVTRQREQERVSAEFLRNASHQLRTPLTAITAAIDVLQAGAKEDPEERDRFLAHIEQHVARMTRLTRSLLVLSRAQAGDQPLRLDFVELRPLLDRLVAGSEPHGGVRIETDCAAGIAALAEPDLVAETLAALLDNAVTYTAQGAIRLAARETDWQTLIEIEDSGIGILPEHRDRVFEPFYQPWQGDGFGLGLAIAREAAEAMGGGIEVDGAPGGGTRFRVRLPSARIVR